jgi:hypothetical protein
MGLPRSWMGIGTGLIWLRIGTGREGVCGYELSGFIKFEELFN